MLKGRIGNQLFQYAAARKIASQNNTELKLDLSNMPYKNKYGVEYNNVYALKFFNIIENIATENEISKIRKKGINHYLRRIFKNRVQRAIVWEKDWLFDPDLNNVKNNNMYLRGIFQSEEYFKDIENIIRKEFTLKEPQNKEYDDMLEKISSCNSISVIIRRGDYLAPEALKTFYQCPPEYFLKGAEIIAEKIDSPKLIIISDGMEWVKKNITFPYSCEYIPHDEFTDYQKLMFMSSCKHHVISNSTFAWWIAWLCQNPNKIVITPKAWLLDKTRNEKYIKHLIPDSWIKI
jgi:hypothetical protein